MKMIAKKLTVALAAFTFAGGAMAGDQQHKENCIGSACSSRKAAEFESEVNRVSKKHPENAAIRDLATKLKGKKASEQNGVLKDFFALDKAVDETAMEKSIDAKLNDNASDKLTNAEVRRLADVLTGRRD